MTNGSHGGQTDSRHDHVYLGAAHRQNERRTYLVIALCLAMMGIEIGGGLAYGSIALVADGLHMSTHAGALLLAALAYTFARRYARDPRFSFGTGKLGDLAGFTSAVVLAMIALLIGYESVERLFRPVPIHFGEAIPIAVLGLGVNAVSAWLLGAGHDHGHGAGDAHGHDHSHEQHDHAHDHGAEHAADHPGDHHRDHNMRAALVHVLADTAVSVLVIVGLVLARFLGWAWMDAIAGIVGALVITSWSYGLLRDTGAILLDMTPDRRMAERVRHEVEEQGDHVRDLHLWRLGPGHLGAIVSIDCHGDRDASFYRARLERLAFISHLTVEALPAKGR